MWIKISDHYEASDDGHIRRVDTLKILKEFEGKDGYLRTQFDGKTQLVHRVIAKAFLPCVKEKPFINHKDGHKSNNAVNNLEWCDRSENIRHALQNGLIPRKTGENNPRAKLTLDQVKFIRKNYVPFDKLYGATQLSKLFGVSRTTITAVTSNQNWKNDTRKEDP